MFRSLCSYGGAQFVCAGRWSSISAQKRRQMKTTTTTTTSMIAGLHLGPLMLGVTPRSFMKTTSTAALQPFRSMSQGKAPNYYDLLEVPNTASQKDIKAAFYRLSMKHHPDRNMNNPNAEHKFRRLSEAYEVLSNAQSRLEYDTNVLGMIGSEPKRTKFIIVNRSRPPPPTGRSPIYNFDEFYEQHYGSKMRHQNWRREMLKKMRQEDEQRAQRAQDEIHPVWYFVVTIFAVLAYEVYTCFSKRDDR